jgi:hypothetical protein
MSVFQEQYTIDAYIYHVSECVRKACVTWPQLHFNG